MPNLTPPKWTLKKCPSLILSALILFGLLFFVPNPALAQEAAPTQSEKQGQAQEPQEGQQQEQTEETQPPKEDSQEKTEESQTPPVSGQAPAEWTYEAFIAACQASGRDLRLSEKNFQAVQQRKKAALVQLENYLKSRFGQADQSVVKAFTEVPREYYHYNYQSRGSTAASAYEARPKPWAIGYGSALSDILGQAYMTQLAAPKSTDVVLEIGTGSGFQISILSRMVKDAYSIEIIKPLGEQTARIFKPLNYNNVQTKVGDGYFGWPEVEGGFDIIMVTCAASYVSPELLKQLKPGGRLIVPIGQPFQKGQVLYVFTKDAEGKVHSRKDMGVYFIPMTGHIQKTKRPSK